MGRKVKETDAENYSTVWAYDAAGNMASKTDAKNQTITYAYDNVNRLTAKNYPNGTSAIYSYDDIGRLVSASWDNHTYTLGYDNANRLTSVIDRDHDKTHATNLTYGYDGKDNRTCLYWSHNTSANTISYSYDHADRLRSISAGLFVYTYDRRGLVTRLDYPTSTGKYLTYRYDAAGRLDQIGGNVLNIDYTYHQDGRSLITKMTAPQNNGEHWDYVYDSAGQLTQGRYENSSDQLIGSAYNYSYDPNGNRGPGQFSPADKAEVAGGKVCVYDQIGNMVLENGNTRTYDYENRLTGGMGLSTRKYTALGQERGYVYDGLREILNLSATLTSYIRGVHGEVLMELGPTNDTNYFAFSDHQGTVMAKYVPGDSVEYARYEPFGKPITSLNGVPFGFAGARWDSQAQKYSMGARHYDPAQGRFITRDTWPGNVWEPWTWNLYQYCKNSPQNYTDPTGHFVIDFLAGLAAGVAVRRLTNDKGEPGLLVELAGQLAIIASNVDKPFQVGYVLGSNYDRIYDATLRKYEGQSPAVPAFPPPEEAPGFSPLGLQSPAPSAQSADREPFWRDLDGGIRHLPEKGLYITREGVFGSLTEAEASLQ